MGSDFFPSILFNEGRFTEHADFETWGLHVSRNNEAREPTHPGKVRRGVTDMWHLHRYPLA